MANNTKKMIWNYIFFMKLETVVRVFVIVLLMYNLMIADLPRGFIVIAIIILDTWALLPLIRFFRAYYLARKKRFKK